MPWESRILKSLNTKRISNATAVLSSFYGSRLRKKAKIRGLPISMSIEPTTACNLGCTQCPSGLKQFTRPTGNLKPELFDSLMEELGETLIYLTLYFQGEPFINPNFFHFVESASRHNIFTATSTNAHFLTEDYAYKTVEAGLGRMIISMDGTSQDSYEKYRINGSLEKVLEGLENIYKAKKSSQKKGPFTELQFIVFKHNEHEIPQLQKYAKQLGVNKLSLKTAQIYDYEDAEEWLPTNPKYRRYTLTENSIIPLIKSKLYNHCWRMWHSCVMTWDGKIVPCCFDKDATYEMGHLKNRSFREIWNSSTYNAFRNQLLGNRKEIDICTNCSEGTKVWI